ncbi:pectin lyase fold/virulence factor [Mycena vulgaris]|nr:pectin lyase fold/virulence factor [Mycena vulgaris]
MKLFIAILAALIPGLIRGSAVGASVRDLSSRSTTQTSAGGVLILDSTIQNTGIGIRMDSNQATSLADSIILDYVAFSEITTANIQDSSGTVLAANLSPVRQWFQGNSYSVTGVRTCNHGVFNTPPTKSPALLDSTGKILSKSRPQYNTYTAAQFLSVKSVGGAIGDRVTDDWACINSFIENNAGCVILFFDAGTYRVSNTIFVPPGTQTVGEMFSTILASGKVFNDQTNPTPVLRVGNPGDSGIVEISDMVISTVGGSQGAVGIEWNVHGPTPGSTEMWDVHVRLGGSIGTDVNLANCPTTSTNLTNCATSYIGFHIKPTGSGYFEVWNTDHDLDDLNQSSINAFSARGILSESSVGPVWLVGTASEHHALLYQYSFRNTENIYAGLIQTETPYFQPTPDPPVLFSINTGLGDPAVSEDAWGLVITNSSNVFVYGAGLYSSFQPYSQACVNTQDCQTNMVLIDSDSTTVYIYQLTTTGSVNMLTQGPDTISRPHHWIMGRFDAVNRVKLDPDDLAYFTLGPNNSGRSTSLCVSSTQNMSLPAGPRKATRQVPMQVLALGFSRTGTQSMRIALETLGYNETNHGFTVWTNLLEIEMWTEAINAKFFGKGKPYGREEWDRLLGHYMAVTDVPHILFAEELIAAYPDAKVILTTRTPDSWWKSYEATIGRAFESPFGAVSAWLEPQTAGKVQEFWRIVFLAMFKTENVTPEIAKARFTAHYEGVRALVPKERLLDYRVGEGWETLCKFLEKDIPATPFPKVNDTQAFRLHLVQLVRPIWRRAFVKYVVPAIFVCAGLYLYVGKLGVFA